jgi:RimJ/RimL family protein N-acetyltransferase
VPPSFPDLVLSTERLLLRPLADADVPALVEAGNDPLTRRWLPLPDPYTADVAAGWVRDDAPARRRGGIGLVLGVEHRGALAGSLDLKRTEWVARVTEIGCWTHPGHRGRGLMPEAVRALAEWVIRDQGFERVELRIAPGNAASLRVAEKAGFTREGTARNAGYVHGGRVDLVIFSLVPGDLPGAGPGRMAP